MAPLPTPATQVDEYLFDIAISLRSLVAAVARWRANVDELEVATLQAAEERLLAPISLREPDQRKQHKGHG